MKATPKIKVHVGVSRGMQEKLLAGGDEVVDTFAKKLGLNAINRSRLKSFGILTGEAKRKDVEAIGKNEGVDFVEQDEARKAM